MGLASASGLSVQILSEEVRLSLWFIHLLRRMVALAVSANGCAFELDCPLDRSPLSLQAFHHLPSFAAPKTQRAYPCHNQFHQGSFHAASPSS